MKLKLIVSVLTIFSTCCCFGQIRLEDLQVDTSITGFRYAADFQGTKVFTKNGAPDIKTVNPSAFSFTIVPGADAKSAVEHLEELLNMSKSDGYTIADMVKKDTTLNGHSAYYVSYTETFDNMNYRNQVFNAYVIKDKTLILFTSGDLDGGKYADQFRKTFYGIKL